jgi:hypothetical protein
MGLEGNKAIGRRWAQVWSAGNFAIVDDLAAPDLVLRYPSGDIYGPDAFKQVLSGRWYSAFPDMTTSVDEVIAEDDKVVCR